MLLWEVARLDRFQPIRRIHTTVTFEHSCIVQFVLSLVPIETFYSLDTILWVILVRSEGMTEISGTWDSFSDTAGMFEYMF